MISSQDFSRARFITSCLTEETFPKLYVKRGVLCPEIALVGRSNVGKSSLINHLTNQKHLVFTSSTPGKTKLINFFSLDDKLLLVDLPGYGYAKTPQEQKETWATALTNYLEHREQLSLLLILLDLRRDHPSKEDIAMISWAKNRQKRLLFVFTKQDKLSTSEKLHAEQTLLHALRTLLPEYPYQHLCYSIKDNSCKLLLKHKILESLY